MNIKTRKLKDIGSKLDGMYHHTAELNGILFGYVWYDKTPDIQEMWDSYWSKILGGKQNSKVRVWRQYMGLL